MTRHTAEHQRLTEHRTLNTDWKLWGPYLGDRQWGTVCEDYSPDGAAWDYLPHDRARSRAYRWGEDGPLGISDRPQLLCFALALWNERDPILKERLFGLSGNEGNHSEDVKEYYYYLDSTPTHSYMKALYKYPQAAFPYAQLADESRRRTRHDPEYELIDTGVFDGDRYFDVFVEYGKASIADVLIRITAVNRGPDPARLHVLPHLWFRNTWSWFPEAEKPQLRAESPTAIAAISKDTGPYWLYCDGAAGRGEPPPLLFTENETNAGRLWGAPNASPYVKDGINDTIVNGAAQRVNPDRIGTKAAAHYPLTVAPGETVTLRLRLTAHQNPNPFRDHEEIFDQRKH